MHRYPSRRPRSTYESVIPSCWRKESSSKGRGGRGRVFFPLVLLLVQTTTFGIAEEQGNDGFQKGLHQHKGMIAQLLKEELKGKSFRRIIGHRRDTMNQV